MSIEIGQKICTYHILQKQGKRGMGIVYKEIDASFNRQVALKFLSSDLTSDESTRKRLSLRRRSRLLWIIMARYVIIILFSSLFSKLYAQTNVTYLKQSFEPKYEIISVEQGLPSNQITCITQDKQGFIWFATASGLCRYDGYKIKVYKKDHFDSPIAGTYIGKIYTDIDGTLWVTAGMLFKYRPEADNFTRFLPSPQDTLKYFNINTIFSEKRYLYMSYQGGIQTSYPTNQLTIFDKTSSRFKRICFSTKVDLSHTKFKINDITINDSTLWLATTLGLFKHKLPLPLSIEGSYNDIDTILFTCYDATMPNGVLYDWINHLNIDRNKNLWFSPTGASLSCYNKANNNFVNFPADPENKHSVKNDVFQFIKNERYGNILVGGNGCNVFDPNSRRYISSYFKDYEFQTFFRDKTGVEWYGTKNNGIIKVGYEDEQFPKPIRVAANAIYQAQSGKICIAEYGLHQYDRDNFQLKSFKIKNKETIRAHENNIYSLAVAPDSNIWLGASLGLYKFNIFSNQLSANIFPGIRNAWRSSFIDSKGIFWGARYNWPGLFKYIPDSGKVDEFFSTDHENTLSSNYVTKIYEDKEGVIWIGTGYGLNKMNHDKNKITNYYFDERSIQDVIEDTHNDSLFWLSVNYSLYSFNKITGAYSIQRLKSGQPVNKDLDFRIQRIAQDKNGNIWMSTNNGLRKYDPQNQTLKKYYKSDGLADNVFTSAHFKSKSGELFFGGPSGVTAFFPDSIYDNTNIPEIVFTSFKVLNKEAKLDTAINYKKHITLPYNENVFSLEYAALIYVNPLKNQFAHKLEGFDRDWIFTGNKHDVTYTNLDPGEYIFRVKGSNHDDVWNETGSSIIITITHPWWQTAWAYASYIVLFILALYGLRTYDQKRQKLKHNLELEQVHAEKLEEVDRIKSRFFTNISHEFRTPLTLIKGPVKQMLDGKFIGNIKEQYRMILRNSDRLLSLINQILDLSKLESGQMKLQVSQTDILSLVKGLVFSFCSLAEVKSIALKFNVLGSSLTGYIDRDKFEKIITNLLSNAFKFTPEGGVVEVALENKPTPLSPPRRGISSSPSREGLGVGKGFSNHVLINISNSGPGIPPDQLDKIFDRFYQTDTTYKKDSESTGIGLALTKELVEACHGEISVDSIPEESTTFKVKLPVDKESFKEDEVITPLSPPCPEARRALARGDTWAVLGEKKSVRAKHSEQEFSKMKEYLDGNASPQQTSAKSAPLLLIIEDNWDVTHYISSFMANDYRILTAENGKVGLKKTIDKYPDLVISDVMMPEMDGFELCNKIKSDPQTSHIPVILLTARADLPSKIEGLEFGADDYISKPFEASELQVRAKNLIEQRRKLREKFSRMMEIKPAEIAATSMDEKFLKRLLDVFENHISETDYSIESFASEIGMSRSNLHRKLKALTNQPTHVFLRILRLKRAAQLLKKSAGTISEIAYTVGFANPSYFSKMFQQYFGQSPGKFIQKIDKD